MALTTRSIILVAVPTFLVAFFGYIWFGKKKKPAIKPPDSHNATLESKANCHTKESSPTSPDQQEGGNSDSVKVAPNQEDTIDAIVGAKSKDRELTLGSSSSLDDSVSGVSLSGSAESVEVEPIQEEMIEQESAAESCSMPVKSATESAPVQSATERAGESGGTVSEAARAIVSDVYNSVQNVSGCVESRQCAKNLSSEKATESNTDKSSTDSSNCRRHLVSDTHTSSQTLQDKCSSKVTDCSSTKYAACSNKIQNCSSSSGGQGDCNSNNIGEVAEKHSVNAPNHAVQRTIAESPTEKLMNSSVGSSGSSNSDGGHSEVSEDSGKGTSVVDGAMSPPEAVVCENVIIYEFDFPRPLAGRLIGQYGRNINRIRDETGVDLVLKKKQHDKAIQSCFMEGTSSQIEAALKVLQRRFPEVDMTQTNMGPVLPPEMMQMSLPEGVNVDVLVSSVVSANHLFVQQPTHPTFMSLERLNQCMISCYTQDSIVPQLPRPIEEGVICAAPMYSGWFRSQVVASYPDTDEVDIKFVDYGGYMRAHGSTLKQIRSDFTSLPFQAIECYLANVIPPKDGVGFPQEAVAVLEELVHRRMLQAQIVAFEQDGVPYIQLYSISGDTQVFINRELVDRGLARWMEVTY